MVVFLASLLTTLLVGSTTSDQTNFQPDSAIGLEDNFRNYMSTFNKTYVPHSDEYYKRLDIFEKSLARIDWLNERRPHPKSAIYGLTKYSDLTPEEFQAKSRSHFHFLHHINSLLPFAYFVSHI